MREFPRPAGTDRAIEAEGSPARRHRCGHKENRRSARESKSQYIYALLKQGIISGELSPDDLIDKGELCRRFGVSRLPVTGAIERLAFDGLVVIEPQRGSYVSRIRVGDVKQWMLVRRVLEMEVAEGCAHRLDGEWIDRIGRNLAYQRAAVDQGDMDGLYTLDVEFHHLMIEGLALDRVGEILQSVRTHIDRVRRILLPEPGRASATLKEHQAIFQMIAARKPEAAAQAMRKHLDRVLRELENFERRHPSFFSL
jgi:GntR family transcriptional regulator, rspAB operon transcriptional repressor